MTFTELPFSYECMSVAEFLGKLARIEQQLVTVSKFMKGLLVFPHAIVDTERVFSYVNLIKTDTRNRLKTKIVSALYQQKKVLRPLLGTVNFNILKFQCYTENAVLSIIPK